MNNRGNFSFGQKVFYGGIRFACGLAYCGGKAVFEVGKLVAGGAKKGYEIVSEDHKLLKEIEKSNEFCEDVTRKFDRKKLLYENEFETTNKEYLKIIAMVEKDFDQFESLEKIYIEQKISIGNYLSNTTSNNLSVADTAIKGGISAGIGVGVGAVGAVTAFGTAGTGAAISGLTGVAYVKATLAALGGGTIINGGLGMVGGALVLGTAVLGPAIIVGALLAHNKIIEKHKEAMKRKAEAQQMQVESERFFDKAFKDIENFREMNYEFRKVAEFFHRLVKLTPDLLITLSSKKYYELLKSTENILQSYGKLNPLNVNPGEESECRINLEKLQQAFKICLENYEELSTGLPLENQELQKLFDRALQTAQKELDIMAWRLGYGIVDEEFISQLELLLKKDVKVKILYGIGEVNDTNNRDTNEIVFNLETRFKNFKNFYIKRTNTHGKIFICDEDFCVISSFNALTNSNFKKKNPNAWEETGILLFNKKRIIDRRKRYFDF